MVWRATWHWIATGRYWLAALHGLVARFWLAWAWHVGSTQVCSDLQELRISGRDLVRLPWAQVRDVRGDAGRWSTRTMVEMQDGREVLLPRGLDVARVRQWQHEAFMAREYPELA